MTKKDGQSRRMRECGKGDSYGRYTERVERDKRECRDSSLAERSDLSELARSERTLAQRRSLFKR